MRPFDGRALGEQIVADFLVFYSLLAAAFLNPHCGNRFGILVLLLNTI